MEVIKSSTFDGIKIEPGLVIALGSFDGLHLGHQAIIKETIEKAGKMNLPSGVYTFAPHPLEVLKPALVPPSLISPRQKIEILTNLGIDYYFEQIFTREFSQLDYRTFVKDFLVDRLKIAHIVIGEDFRFGRRGKGDIHSLKKLGREFSFTVTGMETVKIGEQRVSSTTIREMIQRGEISSVPEFFGRYYRLDGKVVHGAGRGQALGIPTANLKLATDYALPPRGVYACYVYFQGKKYRGIANFGVKPTFAGKDYSIEVHILDFPNQDLYGENISIELVDFIREEMTFSSSEELVEQIKKDILYTDSLLCYN